MDVGGKNEQKGLRKHNKKLRNFYASLYISKSKRWAVYVAGTCDKKNAYRCEKGKGNKRWKGLKDKT